MAQIWVPGACGVAIKCKDGVILGNDTRSTYGYTVDNKNVTKIFPLAKDGRIAMTCYGLIGDFQALSRVMQAQANIYELREGYKISVQAMAKMVANYLYQRKMAPLYAMIIIAGVDETGPQLYTLDPIGSLTPDEYGVAGSASTYAVGILEAEFKPKMSLKKGYDLMKKTIFNAIKRDAMSGDGVDIMTISMTGVESKRLSLEELGE